MDLTKKWHRSEFVSHEMLEVHRGIECELDFYSAIANGEIELVQENCNEQAFTNPEGMGVLSTDALRNIRYHYVVTVALITRFCVHEGLEQEKAYNLSDFYILEMDKCKTIEQISKLHDVMCLDFCKHMHEIKTVRYFPSRWFYVWITFTVILITGLQFVKWLNISDYLKAIFQDCLKKKWESRSVSIF